MTEPDAYLVEGPDWKRVFFNREAAEKLASDAEAKIVPLYRQRAPTWESPLLAEPWFEKITSAAESCHHCQGNGRHQGIFGGRDHPLCGYCGGTGKLPISR
ncbi:hypothetical protein [Mesorhizobium sp.]|uniref:hypothetical protein n=1 Tax=Mesorhizobium sp. TaxID=1871066 RepID=UPI000FE9D8D1|nr:hypothetical protein [Mesorhizobium sp.]RWB67601.1 MAG: hypothetical protein EOQ49_25105 [Mesorhizobium sp.]